MESKAKVSAKDFFVHLGAFISVYILAGSFISLVFSIINKIFPEIGMPAYWPIYTNISMPVATIIVVFPIMLVLFKLLHQSYVEEAHNKQLWVRKWLTYITLFVTSIVWITDIITILYKFIDGQNLTTAFLLKALTFLIVSSFVFYFYLEDMRDGISKDVRGRISVLVGLVLLAAIISGFATFGSPRHQKMLRYDEQKINDLISMQYSIENFHRENYELPIQAPFPQTDIQTGAEYEYVKVGDESYKLCANFNLDESELDSYNAYPTVRYSSKPHDTTNSWNHSAGRQCFTRNVSDDTFTSQSEYVPGF